MTILTATRWPTNGHLINDVAQLGYLDGSVLDVTYGLGGFWTIYHPAYFQACDLDAAKSPFGRSVDFRLLPWTDKAFDSVVFDPPYKLNGTPNEDDSRYGVHESATRHGRLTLIMDGEIECARVARHYLLVKCMDQVEAGKKRWQTLMCIKGVPATFDLVDRFDMLRTPREQPHARQVHTRGNYSTLLVFERVRSLGAHGPSISRKARMG